MLSPATFIGIANAAIGQSASAAAPARAPAHAPGLAGRPANVQPARVLSTPPVAAPVAPPTPPKSASTALSGAQAAPPRNLPRGSLLDLSV
jgi:hypothetical protein